MAWKTLFENEKGGRRSLEERLPRDECWGSAAPCLQCVNLAGPRRVRKEINGADLLAGEIFPWILSPDHAFTPKDFRATV